MGSIVLIGKPVLSVGTLKEKKGAYNFYKYENFK